MRDIRRLTKRDTQPFALTDGIVDVALVITQYFSVLVDILTRAYAFVIIGHIRAQERAVVIVRNETNLLALALDGQFLITVLTRYLAHLVFGQVSQRENSALELLLRQHPEEIGLVLFRIHRRTEEQVSVTLGDAGIVTRCDEITAVLVRHTHQFAPLDMAVA